MARDLPLGPVYVSRARSRRAGVDYRVSMPAPLAPLPYRVYAKTAEAIAERRFIAELKEGDVAYIWPAASLQAHEAAHARGLSIVAEGINTRMAHARGILDMAYEVEGLPPQHGITDARIHEEERKLELSTVIFAPSPAVEKSLQGSPIPESSILPASYGVALPARRRAQGDASGRDDDSLRGRRVLFVGYGCIRKGLHMLLRGWERANLRGRLTIAGRIEPAVARICATQLARDDVNVLGFVRDVDRLYARSDILVLPSFEEGDPLVTYEAAAHGLAIIASPMGGGRIGSETGCIVPVNPAEPDTIAAALQRLADDPRECHGWGARSQAAVESYTWEAVAARRAGLLRRHLRI